MNEFLRAAIEEAERGLAEGGIPIGSARIYRESTIYTTLSPCAMCSGTILLYGIPRVVVGENRTFLDEEDLLRSRGLAVDVLHDAGART